MEEKLWIWFREAGLIPADVTRVYTDHLGNSHDRDGVEVYQVHSCMADTGNPPQFAYIAVEEQAYKVLEVWYYDEDEDDEVVVIRDFTQPPYIDSGPIPLAQLMLPLELGINLIVPSHVRHYDRIKAVTRPLTESVVLKWFARALRACTEMYGEVVAANVENEWDNEVTVRFKSGDKLSRSGDQMTCRSSQPSVELYIPNLARFDAPCLATYVSVGLLDLWKPKKVV